MVTTTGQYLLRVWGRDQELIAARRKPDLIERDGSGVLCYWFETPEARAQFKETLGGACVVRDEHDPGVDWHGEDIDTRSLTTAEITLHYEGRDVTFRDSFGYGYAKGSAEFMWREGNYSCDCNKRLFLWRHAGVSEDEIDARENPCGDTISLVALRITKEPLQ